MIKDAAPIKVPWQGRAISLAVALALAVAAAWLVPALFSAQTVHAEEVTGALAAQNQANEACLACHSQPSMTTTLPSGETLYLTVDTQVFNGSVHGQQGHKCTDCHVETSGYPHPTFQELGVTTRRSLAFKLYRDACVHCHQEQYDKGLDGVHSKALAAGDTNSAICTDCHGTHNITVPDQPRSRASQMCERCHSTVFELYKESIHGAALIGEGNADVPGCVDCHQVHSVQGPSISGSFHLFSPEICHRCHADTALMGKYGINADVFDTYVADFHGTTVALFQKTAPDQETNKPVCIDCHGVHNMKQVDDPESTVIKQNLLVTCQKCHPDADANFPTSWISHYRPDPRRAPLVFFVNLFYWILIPAVLGFMVIWVALDARKRIASRRKERQHA